MPRLSIPNPRALVPLEKEMVVDDVQVELFMWLDLARTGGDWDKLLRVEGDVGWTWKDDGRGAVVMVNCDDDAARKKRDCDDVRVNGDADASDIARLGIVIKGVNQVPKTWSAWLEVDKPDKLRIFGAWSNDAAEIVGPYTARSHKLTAQQLAQCANGGLQLGMEGLAYAQKDFADGQVKLTLRVNDGVHADVSDSAMIKVAPWMIPHHGHRARYLYAADTGVNREFLGDLDRAVNAAGCKLVTMKAASEARPRNGMEVLDLIDCYTTEKYNTPDFLGRRQNSENVFESGVNIKVLDEIYFNETTRWTLQYIAEHIRRDILYAVGYQKQALLDYDGGKGQSNRDYIKSQGDGTKGRLRIPPFWHCDDVTVDGLDRLAERFDDPPMGLFRFLKLKHQDGTELQELTNAERLYKRNAVMSLPDDDDKWLQDCMEIGYSNIPGAEPMTSILRAPRNRPLRSVPEELLGRGVGYHWQGTPQRSNTFDAFGNLECTPPCAANGKRYPWGRIYYGKGREATLFDPDVEKFLDYQKVQQPFTLNSEWLGVGHVDEMLSWVPSGREEGKYMLLIADAGLAFQLLKKFEKHPIQRGMLFRKGKPLQLDEKDVQCNSIAEFFAKGLGSAPDFERWQQAVQKELDKALEILVRETGVNKDSEVIRVPILYQKRKDKDWFDAITACMVNLVVLRGENANEPHCLIPKPYGPMIAESEQSPPFDLFEQAVGDPLARLGVVPHFIDDWDRYHAKHGEIHCGTNTLRLPPPAEWWRFDP